MAPKPHDPTSGVRRPTTTTSSPSAKGDRETQHAKKRVKAMDLSKSAGLEIPVTGSGLDVELETEDGYEDSAMPDKPAAGNVWTKGSHQLFARSDEWYVA
ncbi:hypothetical protein LINGRAHAP2_LOCUS24182 [Linum grandiflorum]